MLVFVCAQIKSVWLFATNEFSFSTVRPVRSLRARVVIGLETLRFLWTDRPVKLLYPTLVRDSDAPWKTGPWTSGWRSWCSCWWTNVCLSPVFRTENPVLIQRRKGCGCHDVTAYSFRPIRLFNIQESSRVTVRSRSSAGMISSLTLKGPELVQKQNPIL